LFSQSFVLVEVRCIIAIRAVEFLSLRFFSGGCCPLTEDFMGVFGVEERLLGVSPAKCLTVLPWCFIWSQIYSFRLGFSKHAPLHGSRRPLLV
jgi:hypothetical protein